MKNKKVIGLYLAICLILVGSFNAVYFIWGGTKRPVSVWLAYAFIHFSFIMLALTPVLGGKSKFSDMFSGTLFPISATYFVLEFVFGLLVFMIHSEKYKATLILNIIFLTIYLVVFFAMFIFNSHTAGNLKRQASEVGYIKDASSRVKLLIGRGGDIKTDKNLESLYDLLHSCPTRSNADVRPLEGQIVMKISELETAIGGEAEKVNGIIGEISSLVNERNRRLRISY